RSGPRGGTAGRRHDRGRLCRTDHGQRRHPRDDGANRRVVRPLPCTASVVGRGRRMAPIPPPRVFGFTTTTPVPLYWARYGPPDATPILVVHGGPGAHHDYLLPQLLALADDYRLIFYDQRGGGRSRTDDRSPITWQTHVADLDAVIQEMSLDP